MQLSLRPLLPLIGCGVFGCTTPAQSSPDAAVSTLATTGLCVDARCEQIAAGIRPYRPRFELWSDAATKRRWIYLPPGTRIDTSDMDLWSFPVGTKLWKEFTRDGTRVETRLMEKILPNDTAVGAWNFTTFQWASTQDVAVAVTDGVRDANGTAHDIPSRDACRQCHEQLSARVLGFDAIQLDQQGSGSEVDLDDLIGMGLLTNPPAGAIPHFRLPGTASEQAALGYLHANCGNCHNPTGVISETPLELRLATTRLGTVSQTPTYMTAVNQPAFEPFTVDGKTYDTIVIPGDPDRSALIGRMTVSPTQVNLRMPRFGGEVVDPTGQQILRAWINGL